MIARNLEFAGAGFSDFALVSAEHPDPARQLREVEDKAKEIIAECISGWY